MVYIIIYVFPDLVKVEEPGDFQKDTWAMDENEKLAAIPRLREEGNELYRGSNFEEAAEKYSLAIGMLEQLLIRSAFAIIVVFPYSSI